MKRMYFWVIGIIMGIALFALLFLISEDFLNTISQINTVSQQYYKNIYVYENSIDLNNSYYIVNRVLSYTGKHMVKMELLMQKSVAYDKYAPFSYTDELGANEIAVSKNIAQILGVDLGDSIVFRNAMTDSSDMYIIKSILPCAYGLYEDVVDSTYGIIIFGENQGIIDNQVLNSVVFGNEKFSASESGIQIARIHSKNESINILKSDVNYYFFIITMVCLIIFCITNMLCYIFGQNRIISLYKSGASRKLQMIYVLVNCSIPSLIPYIVSILVFFVYAVQIKNAVSCILFIPIGVGFVTEILFAYLYRIIAVGRGEHGN